MIKLVRIFHQLTRGQNMQKITVHGKGILALILTLSMVFFCAFSFDEFQCGVFENFAETLAFVPGHSTGRTELKQDNSTRIKDGILSEIRTFAELEKEKLAKNSSNHLDNAALYTASMLFWLFLSLAFSLIRTVVRSLLPVRYSIISYVHRSDGKKPAFLFV